MEKKEIVEKIRAAKSAHIKFKSYVNITINGFESEEIRDALPMNNTECTFGKWYYGEGMSLSSLLAYSALDKPHEMVHSTYIKIYTLQKSKIKAGFFDSESKLQAKKDKEIASLAEVFNSYCEILINLLNELEVVISKMTQEELSKLE